MNENICPVCGGNKADTSTSFTVDFKTGVAIVREVPVKICVQCGEKWLSNEVSEQLEKIVGIAKDQKQEFFAANYNNYLLVS